MSRTREAPTPTNISTKSEPEIEKNGTFASPAIARASSVLPVPGRADHQHAARNLAAELAGTCAGSCRNSTISPTSSFASSHAGDVGERDLDLVLALQLRARLVPNDIAPRPPPPACIWRMKYTQTAINSRIGNEEINSCSRNDCCFGALRRDRDVVLLELADQRGVGRLGAIGDERLAVVRAADHVALEHDLVDRPSLM